jgi:hypothetical protein
MPLNPTDWAYLAGFLEADGSISSFIQRGRWVHIRLTITQRVLSPLDWINEKFGGRITDSRTYYRWRTSGGSAASILEGTLPFLKQKNRQAKIALEIFSLQSADPRAFELHKELQEAKRDT